MNSEVGLILNLSNRSEFPLYEQIERQIRAQILTGTLAAGFMLPSIRDLAQQHRISVITVQKAYDELVRGDFVFAQRGKGFVVNNITNQDKLTAAQKRCRDDLRGPVDVALNEGLDASQIKKIINELLTDLTDNHVTSEKKRS